MILIGMLLFSRLDGAKWYQGRQLGFCLMLLGRIIRLSLVVLLSLGLGAGTGHHAQAFAAVGKAALSATLSAGHCNQCEDCAKPCVATTMCGTACISLGIASGVEGVTSHTSLSRFGRHSDRPFSSAELLTPTPPPRFNHLV